MSSLIVEIVKIDKVISHPTPDTTNLEIAVIKGWNSIIKKGTFKEGDLCVYFPIDSILPLQLSETIGVTKYLHKQRVKAAKLRGVPSYGLLWGVESCKEYLNNLKEKQHYSFIFPDNPQIGLDVAQALGVTKWGPEAPAEPSEQNDSPKGKKANWILFTARWLLHHGLHKIGQKLLWIWKWYNDLLPIPDNGKFHKYTDIENLRNFPKVFADGEMVVFTEKIHGSNVRLGYIDKQFMVGSHNVRKSKKPNPNCKYWGCLTDNIKQLMKDLYADPEAIIVYGEIYGSKIQDLTYGLTDGKTAFRIFDIKIGDEYMDYSRFTVYCHTYRIEQVPELYAGPYSFGKIKEIEAKKNTTIPGASNMMEGIVIRPATERIGSFKYDFSKGRAIAKYVFETNISPEKTEQKIINR